MTNHNEIKNAILNASGNPETGIVVEFADTWANAIVELINGDADASSGGSANKNSKSESMKETRIVEITEKR